MLDRSQEQNHLKAIGHNSGDNREVTATAAWGSARIILPSSCCRDSPESNALSTSSSSLSICVCPSLTTQQLTSTWDSIPAGFHRLILISVVSQL